MRFVALMSLFCWCFAFEFLILRSSTFKARDAGTGNPADLDTLISLLIQFSAISRFPEKQRAQAEKWLLEVLSLVFFFFSFSLF